MEANEKDKLLVKDLNEHIVCPLCRGYLIDATTLVECLHSFCRGCIVRRLSSGARECPVCNVSTSPPLMPDPKLQRLVYLAVPGLFRSELERRRHFRLVNPQCPPLPPPLGALELTLDDFISLSLCELRKDSSKDNDEEFVEGTTTRYLKCPAGVTVRHLVRLLTLKRGWDEANAAVNTANRIEIMCEENDDRPDLIISQMRTLNLSWTLLDLACIFGWKREAPMRLFYRVIPKEESVPVLRVSDCDGEDNKMADSPSMENIQRPPTPPPSPKTVQKDETRQGPTETGINENSATLSDALDGPRIMENSIDVAYNVEIKSDVVVQVNDSLGEVTRNPEVPVDREKEAKTKKPRCEVTPVMRTPDPVSSGLLVPESTKDKKLARLEHRKQRKRRNKRVIAEITTTPREDLLKLKVRLTPCPPRITSVSPGGQTKEKLLQMRAVRREKIKTTNVGHQRPGSLNREDNGEKSCAPEPEETIEQIIDSIPDEVVRIAQNIGSQDDDATVTVERYEQKNNQPGRTIAPVQKDEQKIEMKNGKQVDEKKQEVEHPKRNEEIFRHLGLVAVKEAMEIRRDKSKQRAQLNAEKIATLDREKLEKQLRESKANRVRSLLAEKQMRDALKSIMSKTKDEGSRAGSTSTVTTQLPVKKKGPPPLAPLRVAKQPNSSFSVNAGTKYERPLDLSNGGPSNDNVLDLSAALVDGFSSFSSSSSSTSSSPSSTSSSSFTSDLVPPLGPPRQSKTGIASFLCKQKDGEQRKGQNTNLMILSNAAVSLRGECIADDTSVDPVVLRTTNIASGKVALRIPQPHQRISGFGMKIKPNLGVRHIPNPQAVVASQYRNQRASYLNAISQQPP